MATNLQSFKNLGFQNISGSKYTNLNSLRQSMFLGYITVGTLLYLIMPAIFQGSIQLVLLTRFLVVGGVFIACLYDYNAWKRRLQAFEDSLGLFAATSGLEYYPRSGALSGHHSGSLFAHGHSRRSEREFRGVFRNLPFSFFNYYYETGSGKSQVSHDVAVMEITLPRRLPHMVIDCLAETEASNRSVLPIEFDASQRLELEGDFHKYFTLYAPDKLAISALTVMAPDAMLALMQSRALCDIEIIDDKVYFYWPDLPRNGSDYSDTFRTVEAVLDEIGDKLTQGDIYPHPTNSQVHSQAMAGGVRLKKKGGAFILLIVAAIVASQIAMVFVRSVVGIYLVVGVMYTMVAVAILSQFFKGNKSRRLQAELRHRYGKSN